MTQPDPIHGQPRVDPRAGASPAKASRSEGGSVAFRALLEKLQEQASRLEASSRSLEGPSDLAGAVDDARVSLDDAVSLGDRLLEAYRESRTRSAAPADPARSTEDPS